MLYVGGAVVALLLLSLRRRRLPRPQGAAEEADRRPEPAAFDPMAGGFPVPPLPGQALPPCRDALPTERELIVSGGLDTVE